jgi:hypothetical protein
MLLRIFIFINITLSWGIHLSPAIMEQGIEFEFLSRHQLSWRRYFVSFLCPYPQMCAWCFH